MEQKIAIIDEIIKRHPSYGLKMGWSYYVGGMVDTGDWYFRKMLDVPTEELKRFLESIISEEETAKKNDPQKEVTMDVVLEYWKKHGAEYLFGIKQ